jgi:hypothetical protein
LFTDGSLDRDVDDLDLAQMMPSGAVHPNRAVRRLLDCFASGSQ